MAVTTVDKPTTDEVAGAPTAGPLRLSLVPAGSAPARIDGAWWPYTRDLTTELPVLTDMLDERWDRITRVTVNPTHWPVCLVTGASGYIGGRPAPRRHDVWYSQNVAVLVPMNFVCA